MLKNIILFSIALVAMAACKSKPNAALKYNQYILMRGWLILCWAGLLWKKIMRRLLFG